MPPHADDSSDDEFEFSGPSTQSSAPAATAPRAAAPASNLPINRTATHLSLPRKEMNQPYDEAVELSASSVESVVSAEQGSPLHGKGGKADKPIARSDGGAVLDADSEEDDEDEEDSDQAANARPTATVPNVTAASRPSPKASPKTTAASALTARKPAAKAAPSESSEDEEEEESDEEQGAAVRHQQHQQRRALASQPYLSAGLLTLIVLRCACLLTNSPPLARVPPSCTMRPTSLT